MQAGGHGRLLVLVGALAIPFMNPGACICIGRHCNRLQTVLSPPFWGASACRRLHLASSAEHLAGNGRRASLKQSNLLCRISRSMATRCFRVHSSISYRLAPTPCWSHCCGHSSTLAVPLSGELISNEAFREASHKINACGASAPRLLPVPHVQHVQREPLHFSQCP